MLRVERTESPWFHGSHKHTDRSAQEVPRGCGANHVDVRTSSGAASELVQPSRGCFVVFAAGQSRVDRRRFASPNRSTVPARAAEHAISAGPVSARCHHEWLRTALGQQELTQ